MAIQEQNIKFLESQVMDDVDNGGGAATNNEIIDGQMNNVFDDISDLDRAYGRFNLRKIFLAVRTLSTDLYGGAKTAITALPSDPAISYTLFSRDDPFDTRVDAADTVESYLHKSSTWHGALLGNHLTNMRTLVTFQRVGSRLPPLGKTLCIVQDEDLSTEKEQYVRIIDMDVELVTFEYIASGGSIGYFDRWVVTYTLSDPLRHDFIGHEPTPVHTFTYTGKARIRDTYVVDAAVYYGTQRLQSAAAIGDNQARAASIYSQLVPSAETEEPIINQAINPEVTRTMSGGTRDVVAPQQAHTKAIDVTAENRRSTWVETLAPIPASGTLTLSYMAQGNWYELRDDGSGGIAGDDPMLGAGTIDYATGAMYVTLGALPDADTSIIMVWGSPVHYFVRAGAASDVDDALEFAFTLVETPVMPTTLVLTWLVGGAEVTATDNQGVITGTGCTGTIDYASGQIALRFTQPPDRNTFLDAAYDINNGGGFNSVSELVIGGQFQMPGSAPWSNAGSGWLEYYAADFGALTVKFHIDAAGVVHALGGAKKHIVSSNTIRWSDQAIGQFDSNTGVVTLTSSLTVQYNVWSGSTWSPAGSEQTQVDPSSAGNLVASSGGTPNPQARIEQVTVDALTLRMLTTTADTIVPDSIEFGATGKTYIDQGGQLYSDIDPQTGSGTPSGSVDYVTATATVTWWADATPTGISMDSLLVQYGEWTADDGFFRTVASPLKPEALQLLATTESGEQIIVSADAQGVISHALATGTVNYALGIGAVQFAEPVIPSTVKYNAVAYSYLPLDADILGIEPVRLPANGKVPIFRRGNVVLIMHAADTAPQTIASGESISCGRTRIGWVRVLDANGATIDSALYTLDRENGTVTVPDVTGLTQPLTVRHTVADLRVATDVQITGHITLSRPLSHDFPADESLIASCLIHGDRRARVLDVWDQANWDGTWSDTHGTEAAGTLNLIDYPITVTNEACDTDRWILRWLSTTSVELLSEKRGLIWSGDYIPGGADIAPINPRTREADGTGGTPYMTIPGAANGGGWAAGNVVRINTDGAISDIWIARAINQSDEPLDDGADGCEIYALGNIDRP